MSIRGLLTQEKTICIGIKIVFKINKINVQQVPVIKRERSSKNLINALL